MFRMRCSRVLVAALSVYIAVGSTVAAEGRAEGIAVKFYGEGHANQLSEPIARKIAGTGIETKGFDCFELPILDPASERQKGVGVDCLRPISTAGDSKGEGIQMEALTFFFFKKGMVVNHGCTSVRPFFEGVGDTGVTHITGSIGPSEFGAEPSTQGPEVCKTDQGVVEATGAFQNVSGEARLSGAVNMSKLGQGIVKFSCLFILKLARDDDA